MGLLPLLLPLPPMSLCPLLLSFLLLPVSLSLLFDRELEGIPDEVLLPLLILFSLGHQMPTSHCRESLHCTLVIASLPAQFVEDEVQGWMKTIRQILKDDQAMTNLKGILVWLQG